MLISLKVQEKYPVYLKLGPSTAFPQHAYGSAGGRKYSSYTFTTLALDGGEWSASCPGRTLPPGKGLRIPTGQEAGWAPEPVWTQNL
jgi:hypothetical protein